MLIWTYFDKVCLYISNISSFLKKFHFPIEVVLNFLQTKKKLGTSFQTADFVELFVQIVSYRI